MATCPPKPVHHTIFVLETAPAHALGMFSFENFPCDVGNGIQQKLQGWSSCFHDLSSPTSPPGDKPSPNKGCPQGSHSGWGGWGLKEGAQGHLKPSVSPSLQQPLLNRGTCDPSGMSWWALTAPAPPPTWGHLSHSWGDETPVASTENMNDRHLNLHSGWALDHPTLGEQGPHLCPWPEH